MEKLYELKAYVILTCQIPIEPSQLKEDNIESARSRLEEILFECTGEDIELEIDEVIESKWVE